MTFFQIWGTLPQFALVVTYLLKPSVISSLVSATGMRSALSVIAAQSGRLFDADRSMVMTTEKLGAGRNFPPFEWTKDETGSAGLLTVSRYISEVLSKRQEILKIENVALNPILAPVRSFVRDTGVQSIYAINTRFKDEINGVIVLYFSSDPKVFSEEELSAFEELSGFASISIHNAAVLSWAQRSKESYKRIVDHTEAFFIQTDKALNIRYLSEVSRKVLGLSESSLVETAFSDHFKVIGRASISEELDRALKCDQSLAFEASVGKVNFLFRAAPLLGSDGSHVGWDFVGLESSASKRSLVSEKKKIEALLKVSSAIKGSKDPIEVAEAGLRGLCEALGAKAGLCYLGKDRSLTDLGLVSFYGISRETARKDLNSAASPSLSKHVFLTGEPALVSDYRADDRVSVSFFDQESLECGLVVPIASGTDEVLGTLGIYSDKVGGFTEEDMTLVLAAANQIGLIIKQSDLVLSSKKQASKISALYRMSHALSTNMTLDEVFQRAFRIINEEVGVERLWLGLLDETGRTLVGHAAFGPGWKRRLVRINIDITNHDNQLSSVILSGAPVKVDDSNSIFGPMGLDRIVKRLEIEKAIFIPLISRGYVLGVLAAQQDAGAEDENLLMSLSSELATLLHARQLEKKIAEGEKMRSLGVLASGIAHNFNNILQGVVGQASLLDIKSGNDPSIRKAVKVINDSAAKGAKLVEKLLSFTQIEEPNLTPCRVDDLLARNESSFQRLLTRKQRLILSLTAKSYMTQVDPSHLVRIVTNLVANANDASREDVTLATEYVSVSADAPFADVAPGEYVRVVVRDRGVGMDEDTLQRCFEPFFTTKDVDERSGVSRSGAGLGLAVAYGLAKRNGGKLVAESDGEGAGFTLYLPVHRVSSKLDIEKEPQSAENTTPFRISAGDRKTTGNI